MPALESIAHKTAEAATAAWWAGSRSGDDGVPLGVVAALSLCGQRDPGGVHPAKLIQAASDEDITAMLAEIWAQFYITRPELCIRVGPIAGWMNDEPRSPDIIREAARVARAAVRAGLLDLTLDPGTARLVDVLGIVYTTLRTDQARQVNGEFFTPASVAKMMAAVTLGDTTLMQPGMSIGEPSAGTGGTIRAAAEVMRERGLNPHDFWWVANDISPLIVAGLAVNMHVWDIGPRVIIGCANTLSHPDWHHKAWEEQRHAVEHRDRLRSLASVLTAFGQTEALISGSPPEPATPPGPVAAAPPDRQPAAAVAPARATVQGTLFD
jgi:hypothetical protein